MEAWPNLKFIRANQILKLNTLRYRTILLQINEFRIYKKVLKKFLLKFSDERHGNSN